MNNYNNGQIHGWNGGECPVHPDTIWEKALATLAEIKGESHE